MRHSNHDDIDQNNREILCKFIADAAKHQDDLSGSVIATMTQFIMNMRLSISKKGHSRGWVSPEEIIDSQIDTLRHCIIDLNAYKERLTKGVIKQ